MKKTIMIPKVIFSLLFSTEFITHLCLCEGIAYFSKSQKPWGNHLKKKKNLCIPHCILPTVDAEQNDGWSGQFTHKWKWNFHNQRLHYIFLAPAHIGPKFSLYTGR